MSERISLSYSLPLELWPRSMQVAALDLPPEGVKVIGHFLADLSSRHVPVASASVADFVAYTKSNPCSNGQRQKILRQLREYLPIVLPGCETVLREATRQTVADHYHEYGRDYDRKKREYRPRRRGLRLGAPIDEWPASWRTAFEIYQRRSASDDEPDLVMAVAGGDHEEARLSARTLEASGLAVSRLLYAARRDPRLSDPDRLSPETLQSYLDALRARGARDTTLAMETKFLASFARHVLGWTAAQREWISLTYRNLNRRARSQPRRKDGKPLPSLQAIWAAGQGLWHQGQTMGPGSQTAFRLARDGLVICFACNVPLRTSDLSPMQFGRDLTRGEDDWALWLNQTKTGVTYRNSLLWPEVSAMLDIYYHRWLLPERRNGYVWMEREPSRAWLASVFANRLGINPHLIRDIVATAVAAEGSDASGVIPKLLGHADDRTADDYVRLTELIAGARTARRLLDDLLSAYD